MNKDNDYTELLIRFYITKLVVKIKLYSSKNKKIK